MASPPSTPPQSNLPPYSRHITTHNASGLSIFSPDFSPDPPKRTFPNGSTFRADFSSNTTPHSFANNSDLKAYNDVLAASPPLPPAFRTPAGTVIQHTETPPGGLSPLHRTLTLDYMCVLEGEVDCILDSGEKKRFRRGDTLVQRGTMHAWHNPSATEWCRMLFVLMPAEGFEVGGEAAKEEFRAPPKI
jgi:hypothetical protein